jgi:hypothetical protein
MADDADIADSRIENMIADGLARARLALERQLPAVGSCHWCDSVVAPGRVFCSKECSDDHEHDRLRRKAAGR